MRKASRLRYHLPERQGLYDPRFEHDSCGVGFVCDVKGRKSHAMVLSGLEVLRKLSHRGAVGADPRTGDGAGILIQIPHEFLLRQCQYDKIVLPSEGSYGTGIIFLPTEPRERDFCKQIFSEIVSGEGQILLGWRKVPIDNQDIGVTARMTEPVIEQIFIGKAVNLDDFVAFEQALYRIRKKVEGRVRLSHLNQRKFFYISSLSSKTIIYKGLLMPEQVERFYCDLQDQSLMSALCLVHSRYSTNTFPTWDLAQPFRFLAHNGEINTVRGNINWMKARQGLLKSSLLGKAIEELFPIIVPDGSDSANLDNIFELLVLSGRSPAHAMTMLVPSAWEQNQALDVSVRAFYQYHGCLMEPWDGPAAIAFTDGISIGAVLDRNGLRPARYIVTKDDFVVMASEVGVLDIPVERIALSGRLEPGKIFFIDTKEGRIIADEEVKSVLAQKKPYASWLSQCLVTLEQLPESGTSHSVLGDIETYQNAFGYTREDLKFIIKPMAEEGKEPVGSMGNDTPLAILSKHPQLLYSYFKQLFAQVTNPAIDSIREQLVMSLDSFLGPQQNILDETIDHCHKLLVKNPILTNSELEKIRIIHCNGFRTKTISILFDISQANGLQRRLSDIFREIEKAIQDGFAFVILSDRGISPQKAAIPGLLATAAIHHWLVKKSLRTRISLLLESGEPREVHHFALLFGYGIDCVNPYLAYESVSQLSSQKELLVSSGEGMQNYRKALTEGILKILSKMGISTLQSYRGAQIFEAVGIGDKVIEEYFPGTASRVGGVSLDEITAEVLVRHQNAYSLSQKASQPFLKTGGVYQWRRDGEFHLWNPDTIASLQDAVRQNSYKRYREFSAMINDQSQNPATLRSLLKFRVSPSVPLDQVEPKEEIFKRFATGAMSFGSISQGAHETLALAMNRIKGKSNTGEGGEDPERFKPLASGESMRSAIKQVASGRFGVTANYLMNADEIQIKVAQGAKPGEGGQLPGHKVSVTIAKTRYTTPGVTLISPPPHHDIYSIEDLAQLIFDLKNVNPRARISVKLVSEVGVGTVAAGVAKGHADMILISGGDGGTGASPLSSIRHAGLPWELGLSEVHQTLVLNDLRSRVRLQTDGQMRTGQDVAMAAILGAEEFGFCTASLIVLGCVMLRHCHLNNCSVGIATQDDFLQKRFQGKVEYVVNYFNFVAEELRETMSFLGVRTINELVGRVDLLQVHEQIIPQKARGIDFSKILYRPKVEANVGVYCTVSQNHAIDDIVDRELIALAQPAISHKQTVRMELPIHNTNRATGSMLSGEICLKYGEDGLPDNTVYCKFNGIAGQSFGAWLMKGITFELEGMANDYVGKGISGGKIIIYPDKKSTFLSEENIILGNTSFYGAIHGEAYIRGVAGERFCIRNSGLLAVVEGVGDHGCEYMTGGRVLILGKTGRNFAAGMSGGIAYVYDPDNTFSGRCNLSMVELEEVLPRDYKFLQELISRHYAYTNSMRARDILDNFSEAMHKFKVVIPLEYQHILRERTITGDLSVGEVSDG